MNKLLKRTLLLALLVGIPLLVFASGGGHAPAGMDFPPTLESYNDGHLNSVGEILANRIHQVPFNLAALIIFGCAILHTFMAGKINNIAHHLSHQQYEKNLAKRKANPNLPPPEVEEVSFTAGLLHFLGEIEVIFGLWVIVLAIAIIGYYDFQTAINYLSYKVNFTEPMFVVVVMTIAATRPVVRFAKFIMSLFARIGKRSAAAWWLSIMTVGPILGSFITEPAAMTLSALLLAKQFYDRKPSAKFCYATIGLLFVNVSVGGTLTHFAAPPVLMVATKWGWGFMHMLTNFGWKAVIGIFISNAIYYFIFRGEFAKLERPKDNLPDHQVPWDQRDAPVPGWIVAVHVFYLAWTVIMAHHPVLFIAGFLLFLGFVQITAHHQNLMVNLKPALLVGFFLAGLVCHGGVQSWWIAPILGRLTELPLMLGSTTLTAFNDNAAITYLASLVPTFTDNLKYAVVAGAVTGGGLTVIANAPNPAGQSILSKYFEGGINPVYLLLSALLPTIIMGLCFMLL